MSLPEPFPQLKIKDYNPAIMLFGNRFFKDQTVLEYLVEFLAVVFSEKWIGKESEVIKSPLPSFEDLQNWSVIKGAKLYYRPPVKLNLKLFAFLSCSKVASRHEVHKRHYKELAQKLENSIKTSNRDVQDVRAWLEDFLRCFRGVGFNRTWCAQTFYPVSASLVTQETIWNGTVARKSNIKNWDATIKSFRDFYSAKHRIFLARGGELLYLQLCNFFTIDQGLISDFAKTMKFDADESNLDRLHRLLQDGLQRLSGREEMRAFNDLVDFIESLDQDTHNLTNQASKSLTCEWCPRDSWQEAYLFAVELKRLLSAPLEPIERLELLMTGCSLQVLRSLCAQSVRYAEGFNDSGSGGVLGYAWIFSSSGLSSRQQRLTSQQNLQIIQSLIQKVLRNDELQKNAGRDPKKTKELYREADDRYGHKLLLSLGKKLGVIVPKTGSGARFVMTDKILRYMVLVLLRPGERCTYDEFRWRLYRHYGIAVEGEELTDAVLWSGLPVNSSMQPQGESWLAEMLRAGGFLTELSDACSIVKNTFENRGKLK